MDASDASEGGASDAGAPDAPAPDADADYHVPTCVQVNAFASGTTANSTLSATFTSAQIAGDLIVAIVFVLPGNVAQTPTDARGNQYHLAKHQMDTGPKTGDAYIWYAWDCAAATPSGNTVTVSVTGGQYQDLIIEEWANIQNLSDPLDTTGGASTTPPHQIGTSARTHARHRGQRVGGASR